jgi:hypothetical protein
MTESLKVFESNFAKHFTPTFAHKPKQEWKETKRKTTAVSFIHFVFYLFCVELAKSLPLSACSSILLS